MAIISCRILLFVYQFLKISFIHVPRLYTSSKGKFEIATSLLSNIKLIKSLRGEHIFLTDYKKEAKKYSLSLAGYNFHTYRSQHIMLKLQSFVNCFVLSMIIFNSEIENDIIQIFFLCLEFLWLLFTE